MNYKPVLEKYSPSKRYTCPACGHKKEFTRYIDENGNYYADDCGRCNRSQNCGFHKTPAQYKKENNIAYTPAPDVKRELPPVLPTSYIDTAVFEQSLTGYESNNLVKFLCSMFSTAEVMRVINSYQVGTSKAFGGGSTVFWQIDEKGKVRSGKIMQYNPATGRRVKDNGARIGWVHSILKLSDYNLKQTFFGCHLIAQHPEKTICITESEKTSLICSLFYKECIWIATGGLNNLTADKIGVLHGRQVIAYPDLKAFGKWSERARELSYFVDIHVSDMLERIATPEDYKDGLDLGDYLVRTQNGAFVVAEMFKNELLNEATTIEMQQGIYHKYRAAGLTPIAAKNVINELITHHNFTVA